MAFTDITSTAEVRAVLGVSEKELRDDVLLLPLYSTRLTEALRDLHTQLLADYASAAALDSRTDDQQRFVDLVQAYASHHIATQCLGALPMFAKQQVTDGKNALQRVADPYAQLRKDVPSVLYILKVRLRGAYAGINPDATPPLPAEQLAALAATRGTDPVTGA
jgi:hypothetical protein